MSAPDAIFQNRSFVLFWLSRVCASIAVQMQSLAVGWQIYNLTGSPFDLGLVGLMQFLPLVSLMLVAGQVADRYDRRAIVQVSLAITGLSVAVIPRWYVVDTAVSEWMLRSHLPAQRRAGMDPMRARTEAWLQRADL